jgi:hypothetical protein
MHGTSPLYGPRPQHPSFTVVKPAATAKIRFEEYPLEKPTINTHKKSQYYSTRKIQEYPLENSINPPEITIFHQYKKSKNTH